VQSAEVQSQKNSKERISARVKDQNFFSFLRIEKKSRILTPEAYARGETSMTGLRTKMFGFEGSYALLEKLVIGGVRLFFLARWKLRATGKIP
jgi:hypothetical protein